MDVPCPKCNNTGLQKVSLACEEVLYLCDNAHQFVQIHAATTTSRSLLVARQKNRAARRTVRAES